MTIAHTDIHSNATSERAAFEALVLKVLAKALILCVAALPATRLIVLWFIHSKIEGVPHAHMPGYLDDLSGKWETTSWRPFVVDLDVWRYAHIVGFGITVAVIGLVWLLAIVVKRYFADDFTVTGWLDGLDRQINLAGIGFVVVIIGLTLGGSGFAQVW